jgi:hypothetical protein
MLLARQSERLKSRYDHLFYLPPSPERPTREGH